jgi:hypothetical protein
MISIFRQYNAWVFVALFCVGLGGCCSFEAAGPKGTGLVYRVDRPNIYRCKTVNGKIDDTTCDKLTEN